MDLFDILINGSWKDKKGNVLTFAKKDKNCKNELIMLIDGADCSEGVEEVVLCQLEDICKAVLWYGYNELEQSFREGMEK